MTTNISKGPYNVPVPEDGDAIRLGAAAIRAAVAAMPTFNGYLSVGNGAASIGSSNSWTSVVLTSYARVGGDYRPIAVGGGVQFNTAGRYLLTMYGQVSSAPSGDRGVRATIGASERLRVLQPTPSSGYWSASAAEVITVAADDTLLFSMFQNSGAIRDIVLRATLDRIDGKP